MSGLIRKDMYCLRKNIKLFVFVTIGVIILSVLFIISARTGNVAKGIEEMKAESEGAMAEETFYSFFRIAIWVILFIPVSFLSMVVECFKEDREAGFSKTLFSMPLSIQKIVGSRYASCLLFAGVGLLGSFLAGVFVSLVSDSFRFSELSGCVFCFCAALLVYMSIVLFMLYFFGVERADLIQCAPFVILFVIIFIFFQTRIFSLPENELDAFLQKLVNGISDFLEKKALLIFLVSLACMTLSYCGSCMVLKKKKGEF